ncbi:nucleotidyltransferase domain-containing protein [Robertmurraya sp. Marseille-Q9965]
MIQDGAVEGITQSLIQDERVQAVFLKGSMGREEYDEFSDVDLYCLVEEEHLDDFLKDRIRHLESYRKIMFFEDFFIIAPQIIAVFDNLLHVDLFTVTEKTFKEKDFFKVLYDPDGVLTQFKPTQNLCLSEAEFDGCTYDVAWFLFQYRKARMRGNDLWAVAMLQQVLINFSKVLLHRYRPERAQLGLKALSPLLLPNQLEEVKVIFNNNTPDTHKKAVEHLMRFLEKEIEWIEDKLDKRSQAGPFLTMMINLLK